MNMSYCRQENTLRDLQDCFSALRHERDELDGSERRRAIELVELCKQITEMFPEGLEAYLEPEEDEEEEDECNHSDKRVCEMLGHANYSEDGQHGPF